jgi:metal transporter CNNM
MDLGGLEYVIIVVLIMLSGLFSGLTLGLLGLDLSGLDIVEHGDNKELAECARKIIPVRRNGNLLLCSLLLGKN